MTAKKTAISSLPKHSEVRKQDEAERISDKIIAYGYIPPDRAKAMTEEMTQKFELYVIRSVADILNADKHSPASGIRSTKRRMGCLCPFYLIGRVEDDKSSKSRKYRY